MNKIILTIVFAICFQMANAQVVNDTATGGAAVIIKDSRLAVLEKKNVEKNINAERVSDNKVVVGKSVVTRTSTSGIVLTSGYRLIVTSTPDRDLAMKIRSQLFQAFPDQKQYLIFQMPNTKIKFGNFLTRPQAEQARKKIMAKKIVANNIYIVSDTVEMKVLRTVDSEKMVEDNTDDKTKKEKKLAKPTPKKAKPTKPVKATK